MKVFFLGNNYNPISITCLKGIIDSGEFTVMVGWYDPGNKGIGKTALKLLSQYGVNFLFRRGIDFFISNFRMAVAKMGGRFSSPRSLRELCIIRNTPSICVNNLHSKQCIDQIRAFKPDCIAVAAFSRILKPAILNLAPRGTLNMHPSALPRYRGPNPLYWILNQNENQSAVSVHFMDEGIDSGDIVKQKYFSLKHNETETSLMRKSAREGSVLLLDVLRNLKKGEVTGTKQDEKMASWYPLPPKGASAL